MPRIPRLPFLVSLLASALLVSCNADAQKLRTVPTTAGLNLSRPVGEMVLVEADGLVYVRGATAWAAVGAPPSSGSVTSTMILDGTIAAGDLATGAVTTTGILDGTVAQADLATGAGLHAAAIVASNGTLTTGLRVASSSQASTGDYTVTLSTACASDKCICIAQSTENQPDFVSAIVHTSSTAKRVKVYDTGMAADPVDRAFSLLCFKIAD